MTEQEKHGPMLDLQSPPFAWFVTDQGQTGVGPKAVASDLLDDAEAASNHDTVCTTGADNEARNALWSALWWASLAFDHGNRPDDRASVRHFLSHC